MLLGLISVAMLALAGALTMLLAQRLGRGEPIEIRAHWGGLGGGTAGWRLSAAFVLLSSALVAWGLAIATALYGIHLQRTDRYREEERADQARKEKLGAASATAQVPSIQSSSAASARAMESASPSPTQLPTPLRPSPTAINSSVGR